MGKVLYIKSNPKTDVISRTYKISEIFIESYKKNNPDDTVVTIDLYKEGIRFLDKNDIDLLFAKKDLQSRNSSILNYAYEFVEADKYVFATPLWNLGIPAILKAYIDYICVSEITFKYTNEGPVGLLHGKKALTIMTRGGMYTSAVSSKMEMSENYLRTILHFLGVNNYNSIIGDGLDVVGQDVDRILKDCMDKAKEMAMVF